MEGASAPRNNPQSWITNKKKQLPRNLRLQKLLFRETRAWQSELSLGNKEPVIQTYSGQLLKKYNL